MEEENILPVKIPFPQNMKREKLDSQFSKFLDILKQIHINIPFIDALLQMPSYAKFLKEILSSKRKLVEASVVVLTEKCSAMLQNKLPQKLGDPGSFTIPCTLGGVYFEKALCDFGASINLMPFYIFRKLDLGEIKNTSVSLQFADQSTKKPKGVIENILVRVDKFVFPVDFIVLEMQECRDEPIILGGPFLATGRATIDVHQRQFILRVDEERVIFDMQKLLRFSGDETSSPCFSIDMISDLADEFKDDKLILDSMERCLSKSGTSQDDDPTIRSEVEILEKHYKDEEIQAEEVQPKMELKILPSHLKYVYLEHIISSIIYPISDSSWVSPVQVVPKKEIPRAPEDQDKTTFTCPHGTYAYRRMPFGLCNAPATFQRCMSAIFSDMTEKILEIFMDDFTLFGKSFEDFTEGIVLGHKITAKGIEVDKAKIDVIARLPPPTTVKSIRSFLGHAGFYRRFIKDFSKISKPLTNLLMKDVKFEFSGDCLKAFETLKERLSTTPIVVSPD
ncbi:uncharacterized protein LOC132639529 [Lycium barbarum]|uniref:uncharacterized protein LOC132639529 n=1 Tax=Lycium barbarum TaxID=112863 RepID=UPI00293E34EA|nr:uncharacterized protein LOC132639529 [Lycium barbarum]